MGTYVSMLVWDGSPPAAPVDVRAAILRHDAALRRRGLHSVVILPDQGGCAAVMIATVADECSAERLARAILPGAALSVESMRFDEDPAPINTPIYNRDELPAGTIVEGPAVIDQLDSTTIVPPGVKAEVDPWLTIIMKIPLVNS